MAIKWKKRVPDGLLLAYPALNLDLNSFTPSYILAIDDQITPYSLLRLCGKAYVPEGSDPQKDIFISPLHASDEVALSIII